MAVRVITLCFLAFVPLAAYADTVTGKVVKVADGDSIIFLDNTNTASGFKVSTLPRQARLRHDLRESGSAI